MNLFKDFDHKICFVQSVTDLNFQVWQKFPLRKVFFIKVEILIDRLIKELHQIIDGLKPFLTKDIHLSVKRSDRVFGSLGKL